MKVLTLIARLGLGLIFAVSVLNFFLQFMEQPQLDPAGLTFLMALMDSNYVMILVKAVEAFSAVLLLTNVAVPLALTILAPVAINIFFFHLLLSPAGLPLAAVIIILMAFLTYVKREAWRPLFK